MFLVDKPAGYSSFFIVRRVRRLLGIKKVGHAGTLDPFATGLLIICVGRAATRCIEQFMVGHKLYRARLQLGVETSTQDPEGEVIATSEVPALSAAMIEACLEQHRGPQMQAPPPFSAAKHQGKPLYAYARQGVMIEKAAKPIDILSLQSTGYDAATQQLDIEVQCSRGTYVRVLAAAIGKSLGCGAHLIGLRRTGSGKLGVDDALSGEQLLGEQGRDLLINARLSVEDMLTRHAQAADCACHALQPSGIEEQTVPPHRPSDAESGTPHPDSSKG